MLAARNLTCVRDERALFRNLSFTVAAGEIVQVEGANGAGKTSLLRILAGLSRAEQGEILWQQESIQRQRESYHASLLYLGHQPGVKAVLTPFENLSFWHAERTADELFQALEQVDLTGYEDVPVAALSAGQQRRVALARLWLSQAALWILDEPLTAIDKSGVEKLMALFVQHAEQGGAVILTTHQDLPGAAQRVSRIRLTCAGEP
ncbi:cytochrome C biogenesis protein CcmA [bacteria symbiont BFo1 of Frankliniella occidentalis]|jgi:heme exporter protein A|uniref:Cytochrome c biogenesis heme-transporting ATPase CcmA n=1 Tax=Erwinia aphidicola TaxID=68334 RepID=A0ABU8DJJ0_ERWAP|nr:MULTISPECIES: cytochrome c biogenesis heme-transporting ATPase CcmA [Erwinia]KMV71595.1 cytochrome C biogenesis protein CcmA [bacteria symbiont BFo1 of Frankliniella occidentalis]PIJ48328.1 heme ABC exporter ATP-binding protein CcmA [Erwinia sp. OLMDLW33]KYP85441.1 cytochrome C biogenesis protein CcmA [bacteria symbiont BFo1 of Frankliniella occidentalis]KYP90836.1 cytochrome C biogenesis protein CcmA [bacteria symbiont BFo1 of Frankliniella occidentalis]MBN1086525.1 cytochrome c biogenesis